MNQNCRLHPDTTWVKVKSLNVEVCDGCIRAGFYNEAVTQEAIDLNPEVFQNKPVEHRHETNS